MEPDTSGAEPRRELPVWAGRVPQWKLRKLYETDAKGIHDEELIDEVGYGLLARCESFILANEVRGGTLPCPCCSAQVEHTHRKEDVLSCDCGWELTWGEYFKTIQHKQLSGAEPVLRQFGEYVRHFPKARTPRERMVLIDQLIHGFHSYYRGVGNPTRPVAINLIGGRLSEVINFLDSLTYGPGSTPGTREAKAEWDRNITTARGWRLRRDRREQGR
jgi:hypothetical protein